MLDEISIRDAAKRLDESERARTQIRQLSIQHPAMNIDDAYAVQKAWVELKTEAGRVVKGHKIGLTSKAMQYSSNINEPDYGVLLDDMFFPDGGSIPIERFIVPRLEVELAFILGKPLQGPELHHLRCAERHGICHAGGGDHRRAHPASGPRNQSHAQGVRHHLGQCRGCGAGGRWAVRFVRWIRTCAGFPRSVIAMA